MRRAWIAAAGVLVLAVSFWLIARRGEEGSGAPGGAAGPAPVEVAAVRVGPIELKRSYSGTLEATARFVVAPKVGGRIERLLVDVSDPVTRDQLVAELDDAEFEQAVASARADRAVARANLKEAESSLVIAQRALDRMTLMHAEGVAAAAQLDTARAEQLAKDAAVEVAGALVTRAEAALAAARIRLGYTQVTASWKDGDDQRVVAERFVDQGDTVTANTPLVSIIEPDPITAVVFVTEKDYERLRGGQSATLTTDAFPGRSFEGVVARIAPVFREASRQARVELSVRNPELRLKPGMFVRAEVTLDQVASAVTVPEAALVTREGETGVFVVSLAGDRVAWRPVEIGIRQDSRVQVLGEGVSGRVVTLGQQLVSDGSAITIPEGHDVPAAGNGGAAGAP